MTRNALSIEGWEGGPIYNG